MPARSFMHFSWRRPFFGTPRIARDSSETNEFDMLSPREPLHVPRWRAPAKPAAPRGRRGRRRDGRRGIHFRNFTSPVTPPASHAAGRPIGRPASRPAGPAVLCSCPGFIILKYKILLLRSVGSRTGHRRRGLADGAQAGGRRHRGRTGGARGGPQKGAKGPRRPRPSRGARPDPPRLSKARLRVARVAEGSGGRPRRPPGPCGSPPPP